MKVIYNRMKKKKCLGYYIIRDEYRLILPYTNISWLLNSFRMKIDEPNTPYHYLEQDDSPGEPW